MVQDQGIDVYLAPFTDISKRHKEYPVPAATSSSFTGDVSEVYTEAVDGGRFVIVVDLGPDFDARGSERLAIRSQVDDSAKFAKLSYVPPLDNASGLKGRYVNDQVERHIKEFRI